MTVATRGRLGEARYQRMVIRHHGVFGHWFVPSLRAWVPHERGYYRVVTNAFGMRDSVDWDARPAGGTRRIIALGDSFTAGDGVDNEERFTDRLTREVPGLQVLNFGLPNSGTDQQILVFEHLANRFGGDAILFCPLVENIRRIVARYRPGIERQYRAPILVPKPYFVVENGHLELRGVPVPIQRTPLHDAPAQVLAQADVPSLASIRRLVNHPALYRFKERLIRLGGFDPYPQYSKPDHQSWLLMRALLRRLVDGAGGRRVLLAPLPTYHYVEGLVAPTYLERFREFAAEMPGVLLADVLPEFQRLSPGERRACRYRWDVHYTPMGHAAVARAIRSALEEAQLA